VASAAKTDAPFDTLFPCAKTEMDLPPSARDGSCSDDEVAWCSQQGKAVACCADGLVAIRADGECGCPPGGVRADAGVPFVPGCSKVPITFDLQQIQAVVRTRLTQINQCYQAGMQRSPELGGRLAIHFEIAPHGEVFFAHLGGVSIADPTMQRCVLDAFRDLRFPPPPEGQMSVSYPLVFSTE
jgi:hypothetical protein